MVRLIGGCLEACNNAPGMFRVYYVIFLEKDVWLCGLQETSFLGT